MEEQSPTQKFINRIEIAAREFQESTGLAITEIDVAWVRSDTINSRFARQDFSVVAVSPDKLKS